MNNPGSGEFSLKHQPNIR